MIYAALGRLGLPRATLPTLGYASVVTALNPVAYWRLGETTGTFLDTMGQFHAVPSGTLDRGVPGLPDQSDGACNFGGTGTAIANTGTALRLPAYTLSGWAVANHPPDDEGMSLLFFARDDGAGAAGNVVIYSDPGTDGVLRFRKRTGSSNVDLDSPQDAFVAGVPFHFCLRSDSSGFDAFVNGQYIGKRTTYTGAWSTNDSPIRFNQAPTFTLLGDCILDEIAIFDRVLTLEEVLSLAQVEPAPPVAVDDDAAVPEEETTAINVLANDQFVGTPSIAIVSQPGGGDSVAVAGQQIEYTAGSVDEDTERTFQYRITDPIGTSEPATVRVTVLHAPDIPPPDVPNANCYQISDADTVEVNSMNALQNAVNNAPAGRQILISPGTYAGGDRTFDPGGTGANPIVIRPADGRGTVTITAPRWTLQNGSSWSIWNGIYFTDPQININGDHHRFTRCRVRQMGHFSWHCLSARDIRIDHCDISDSLSNTTRKAFVRLDGVSVGNGSCRRILVDYNYCHHSNPAEGVNGSDYIGLHSSTNSHGDDAGLIIDHNLFEQISLPGEGELIGAKCSGIIFRYNTVLNMTNPYINAPRQARDFEVRSCWFENTNSNVVHGFGQGLLIGNRFVGSMNMWVAAGDYYYAGTLQSGGYPAADGRRVIGNRMGSGRIQIGGFWSNQTPLVPARNNNLWANTRDSGGDAHQFIAGANRHTGTTFEPDNEPYTPAVKLTPAQVGMAAPDPLCPSGPQS